jgi:hypothetical protein
MKISAHFATIAELHSEGTIDVAIAPIPIQSASTAISVARWWKAGGDTLVLLGGIILLAGIVRFYEIGKASFWIDELISSEQTTGMGRAHERLPAEQFLQTEHAATALHGAAPWWNIWTSLQKDDQPPLYFLALRVWRGLFGEGDVPARAFSGAVSLLAVLLLYFAAEPLHGRTPALWACLIMSLAGPQIEYAQEAGGYAMVMMLSLAMAIALVRIEKRGSTLLRFIALGSFALAAVLTHYCAAGAVVASLAYALIRFPRQTCWRAVGVLFIAVIVFLIAWGPFLIGQFPLPLLAHPSAIDQNLGPAMLRWLELPVRFFVNGEIEPQAIALWSAMLYFLPFLLLRRRPDLLLWSLWLVATTFPLAMLDARYSINLFASMRCVLIAAPAAYGIVAAALADQHGYRKHAVALVLSLCCVLTLPDAYVRWKEDWRGFAAEVAACCKPGDVMVLYRRDDSDFDADAIYLALSHYLPQGDDKGSFALPIVVARGPIALPMLQQIGNARHIWLVNDDMLSVAGQVFPGKKTRDEEHFPLMPYAATIARIELVPPG